MEGSSGHLRESGHLRGGLGRCYKSRVVGMKVVFASHRNGDSTEDRERKKEDLRLGARNASLSVPWGVLSRVLICLTRLMG